MQKIRAPNSLEYLQNQDRLLILDSGFSSMTNDKISSSILHSLEFNKTGDFSSDADFDHTSLLVGDEELTGVPYGISVSDKLNFGFYSDLQNGNVYFIDLVDFSTRLFGNIIGGAGSLQFVVSEKAENQDSDQIRENSQDSEIGPTSEIGKNEKNLLESENLTPHDHHHQICMNSTCSHICSPVSERPYYRCSCPDNLAIVLSNDKRECIPPSEDNFESTFLILTESNQVKLLHESGLWQTSIPFSANDLYSEISAAAYSAEEQRQDNL